MPSLKWSELSGLQRGRYAEYYAKMEFTSYGYEVYASEIDDRGIDFIVRNPKSGIFFEVQVKSLHGESGYVFIKKSKMKELTERRLLCYIKLVDDKMPQIFIIPSTVWKKPNGVFVDREYKPPKKSEPEWGINVSKRNFSIIEKYSAENFFKNNM